MIPYRRQRAINAQALNLPATDLAIGDTVLIRRPGAATRTAETVIGIKHLPGRLVRVRFNYFTHETSNDMPVAVESFTAGTWRQWDPEDN